MSIFPVCRFRLCVDEKHSQFLINILYNRLKNELVFFFKTEIYTYVLANSLAKLELSKHTIPYFIAVKLQIVYE